MTIADICLKLNELGFTHRFYGDEKLEITGFSDPKDYKPNTMIWIGKLADIQLKEGLTYTDIALAFVKPETELEGKLPNVLVTDDPKTAFMKLVYEEYATPPYEYTDPTAYISTTAKIGKDCYIGRNVIIEDGVILGDCCEIRENTFIGKDSIVGNHCVIGQNCVIAGETNGSTFQDTDGILKNMPNLGRVIIGNATQIGAGSLIAKGTFTDTVIGNECELNAGTSVGHNCKIGNKTLLLGRCTLSGNTKIGNHCQLISACVKNRIVIGNNVKVGMGSVVLKDIEDGKTCFGNPARIIPG